MNTSTAHFTAAAADSVATSADMFNAIGRTLASLKEVGLFLDAEEMSSEMMEAFGLEAPIYSDDFQELLEIAQSPLFGAAVEEDVALLMKAQSARITDFAADVEAVRSLLLSNTERTGAAEYKSMLRCEGEKAATTGQAIEDYVQTHMAYDVEGVVAVEAKLELSDEMAYMQGENYRTCAQVTAAKIEELMLEGKDILAQMAEQDPSLSELIANVDEEIAAAPLQFARTAVNTIPRLAVNALFR